MDLRRLRKLAGLLTESAYVPYVPEYKVGDSLSIGGQWWGITEINADDMWIADQDGEEREFTPGEEDRHDPVQEDVPKGEEDGGPDGEEDDYASNISYEEVARTSHNWVDSEVDGPQMRSAVWGIFMQYEPRELYKLHQRFKQEIEDQHHNDDFNAMQPE